MNSLKLVMPSADQLVHRLERLVVDAADDLVEGVVDRAVAVGLARATRPARPAPAPRSAGWRSRRSSSCRPTPPRACRSRTCPRRWSRRTASPCGCGSRSPPGTTYLPVASITCRRCSQSLPSAVSPGATRAAMVSPSTRTSTVDQPVGETTVPPLIRVVHQRRSGGQGHQVVVRVRPAVAVERPAVAHLWMQVQVEVADDQLRLVRVARVADDLALGVDEVRLAVEVVVAEVLDADPVDRADEVLVGDRRGRLLELPEVLAQAAAGGRGVEDDLRRRSGPAPASPRGSAGRSRCRRRPCRPRCRTPGSRRLPGRK